MRKFKLVVIALIIGTSSLFAFSGNSAISSKKEQPSSVDSSNFNAVKKPNVKLTFSINSESKIVVLAVNSKEREVLNFVRENVNGKEIKGKGYAFRGDEKVTVTFSVNSESAIVVLAVDSRNSDILNYVRKNLNGQK